MGSLLLVLLGGLVSSRLCSAYEGLDMCWEGDCHPDSRCTDCPTDCSSCPTADPASWREREDVGFSVSCRRDSAMVRLGLEKMLDMDAAWLDDFSAEVVYTSKAGKEVLPINNLYANEVEVPGLRPGFNYSFSLNLKKGSYVRSFQQHCSPSKFFDDDMCGKWDLSFSEPPPLPEFSCPASKPEESLDDDGLHEDWPWIGRVTDTRDDTEVIGVVISDDTVVTDTQLDSTIQGYESFFTFTVGAFSSRVTTSRSGPEGKILVVTLAERIPPELLRPVCLPPKGYVEKMVQSQSCKERRHQKITEVILNGGTVKKEQYEVVDQNSCSLSFLNSRQCTSQFETKYAGSDVMRRDTHYIDSKDNKICHQGECIKDVEAVDENYYKCHVGAITSVTKCKLAEIDAEAKCKDIEDDSCVGFVAKGLKDKKGRNSKEDNILACAKEVEEDYSGCIVDSYEEISASNTSKKDDRHYKGVNCLHDFIKPAMAGCAAEPGKQKSLGKNWVFDPCGRKKGRERKVCYSKPEFKYFKEGKPFRTYWSKSMVRGVQEFAEDISEELKCSQCSAGTSKCVRGKGAALPGTGPGQSFLFWFDSCRDKWFFVGPSHSKPLRSDLNSSCNVPSVHSDLETVTALMRETVAGKVKQISLYPKPVVVVLGPTGVGKSTTGNALLSGNRKFSNCFSTGSDTTSKTKVTDWRVGKWLGKGSCMTVVDTPGTSDTSGAEQDYENIKELTRFLKEDLKEIDIFLVMFKEPDLRFVPSMQEAIKLFESIFGKELFWSNVATEFTFWDFDEKEMKKRYERYCDEDDLNCPSIFSRTRTSRLMCDTCHDDDNTCWDTCFDNERRKRDTIEDVEPCYENCYPEGTRKKREAIGGSQDVKCKLMTASTTNAVNKAIFNKQDLNQENWRELVEYEDLDKSAFLSRGCVGESESSDNFYEKADFVSRYIKKTIWNERYNLGPEHNIPALFIHPVWDTSSDKECWRFHRETSHMWEVVNNMTPFKCTSICQAPDEIFLGTPQILKYLNQPSALVPYRTEGSFSLTCTLWNGIGLSGVRGQDIKWFQGWHQVNIADDSRWNLTITEDEKDADQTIVTMSFKPRSTDVGLYDCTLSGVKELSTLSYSTSQLLSYEAYEDRQKTNSDYDISCILKMKKSRFDSGSYGNLMRLHFAKEIDPEKIPRLEHFSKSTTKNTVQYSISSLTFNFSMQSYDAFEGTYACKRMGNAGYSNSVEISLSVDASWSSWSPWSHCTKSCLPEGETHGTQSRSRVCTPPKNGGVVCANLHGSTDETEPCNIKCCPRNGTWSDWSKYSACTKTCSNEGDRAGVFSRSRTCVPAQCGGIECKGDEVEGAECNSFDTNPCPIFGQWGEWGLWSGCVAGSSPCNGKNHRIRECNNPAPAFGGPECSGQLKEEFDCDIPDCPVDCACNPFKDNWSFCSKTCSVDGETPGVQTSVRECIEEANNGATCKQRYEVELGEQLTKNRSCNSFDEAPCEVHGNWGEWQDWSDCKAGAEPCHGKNHRKRECNNPAPANGGHGCSGTGTDQKFCDVPDCPVDCTCMDENDIWSQCSKSCTHEGDATGTQTSTRACTEGANGGGTCTQVYGKSMTRSRECNSFEESPCPIHGNWGDWKEWSSCEADTSPCNGKSHKIRLCNSPAPENGGNECSGLGKEERFCDVPDCPVDCVCNPVNEYWSTCSKSCTAIGGQPGRQTNERICKEEVNNGKTCHQKYEVELKEPLTRSRECNPECCPENGYYTEWTTWGPCDKKSATHTKTRTCVPELCGGNPCNAHTEETGNCDVDCDCTGISWSTWSACSSACPKCATPCGDGERKQTRVCNIHRNGGRRCDNVDQLKTKDCKHPQRCAMNIAGIWGVWGEFSKCSAKCGGGFRERSRECTYPEEERLKSTTKPYDNDYDSRMPCIGEGIDTEGKGDGKDKCNPANCELSTLVFLMDTTGSFSGVDQNSALDLARGVLAGLKKEKVNVPKYRLITINDPETDVGNRISGKNSLKTFKKTLTNLYKKKHPDGGDWPEQSLDGILKGMKDGGHGEVFCLFTDAPSHQLSLKKEILRRQRELDVPIFVFITPDYTITNSRNEASFRVYQEITRRHTYIMSQIDPSSLITVIKKMLRNSKPGCLTYAGPTETVTWKGKRITRKWADSPNECQFPFWHGGTKYETCTTADSIGQPWCATAVQKKGTGQLEMVPGMWGYCGDCLGTVRPQCKPSGHTILNDSWRAIKGAKPKGKQDDKNLAIKWYRFKVPGKTNVMPTWRRGDRPKDTCGGGARFGSIELGSAATLAESVPHDEGVLEQRICFDTDCANFRRVEVLWCPPDPVGGKQTKTGKPFHIFKLKPLAKLGNGLAYCVN